MKLIIDIDEDYYKSICIRTERFGRGSAILPKSEKIIFNGTPFSEEFEKLKSEIGLYYGDCLLSLYDNDEDCKTCNKNVFESILRKIDNHIAELKGE